MPGRSREATSMPDQSDPFTQAAGRPPLDLSKPVILPLLTLVQQVAFPEMLMPIQVGRAGSRRALDAAEQTSQQILIATQRSPDKEEAEGIEDLYGYGIYGIIERRDQTAGGPVKILVQGLARARLVAVEKVDGVLMGTADLFVDRRDEPEALALMAPVLAAFETYASLGPPLPSTAVVSMRAFQLPGLLADFVGFSPEMSGEERQEMLATLDVSARLRLALDFLHRGIERINLANQLSSTVQEAMLQNQRRFLLGEQKKAIDAQISLLDGDAGVGMELRDQILAAGMPEEVQVRALRELDRLSGIPAASPEVGMLRTYLDWLISLPWSIRTEDKIDLVAARKILDEDHYGLDTVKERILEFLAVRKLTSDVRSPILAFVGPPGVGKTSLGKSIARAMGRNFFRMSLGGLHDEAEIRGHRRTYLGSMPGRIISGIRTSGSSNPVFMLDEIDKVGADFRGDPSSALLEVLDPEQNVAFADNYLEVPFDLSRVLFLATGNLLDPIPAALRDRMEVVNLPGYTEAEKLQIARRFLLPRTLADHGLTRRDVAISDTALAAIIERYTREAGVRNLERELGSIMRKVARSKVEGRKRTIKVEPETLAELLGPPHFDRESLVDEDELGTATGLVVTASGGDVVAVEATVMEGKEDFILTGQLGEVMRESARTALSWIRANAVTLDIEPALFERRTVHIHVPAGAVPKDGPSAGVTMAVAMVSALTRRPVHREVAMTGEITLRGRVLPIGGVKSKVLAAARAGATIVILPEGNAKDLSDIPAEIQSTIDIRFVSWVDQVLDIALERTDAVPPLMGRPTVMSDVAAAA
jgi:ATP-dependent Lon protease